MNFSVPPTNSSNTYEIVLQRRSRIPSECDIALIL